jgi:hypothetical protein
MDSHSGILTRAEITGKEHGTFPAHLRKDGRRFYGYELKEIPHTTSYRKPCEALVDHAFGME